MKKSFTLIEMIFVIVIVGILSVGALQSIPDNTLLNNTKFVYNKILEKKANALSFMANMDNGDENRTVCVTFNEDWLRNDENYSKVKFDFSHRVTITSDTDTICFDYLGRPYKNGVDLVNFTNLLHNSVDIQLSYNGSDKNITIYPITGYVEIK
jgi:prepilin-type N-terminal cleavage/methylation domain-containing protein